MVEMQCPWCEATLALEFSEADSETTCPECLTSWTYETTADEEAAVPLAA